MDLVIRATVIFFFIFLVTRVVGRRQLSNLEPFDVILLVVIGDLVQQGITQSDNSVTGSITVISTIAVLSVLVAWVAFRFRRLRLVMDGEPIIVVQDGEVLERNLRRERITVEELEEELRQQQLPGVSGVAWAILETDGRISCIPKS
jgi:uncharacterized membrane protein YcaP (DUF421 family)